MLVSLQIGCRYVWYCYVHNPNSFFCLSTHSFFSRLCSRLHHYPHLVAPMTSSFSVHTRSYRLLHIIISGYSWIRLSPLQKCCQQFTHRFAKSHRAGNASQLSDFCSCRTLFLPLSLALLSATGSQIVIYIIIIIHVVSRFLKYGRYLVR